MNQQTKRSSKRIAQKIQTPQSPSKRQRNEDSDIENLETDDDKIVINADTVRSIGSLLNTRTQKDTINPGVKYNPKKIIFRKNDIIGVYFGKQRVSPETYAADVTAPYAWKIIL